MVEPLRPELREELKDAHDGLQDADIDRLEELIALRFTLDPQREAEELRAVDREREVLLRERMPRFEEIYQRFRARQVNEADRAKRGPEVQIETRRRGPEQE
jgi:hypothetical protein